MNDAAQILVIILASVLAIFLVLSIILIIKLIIISNQIKRATKSVADMSESAKGLLNNFAAATSPVILVKTIKNLFNKFKKTDSKKGDK